MRPQPGQLVWEPDTKATKIGPNKEQLALIEKMVDQNAAIVKTNSAAIEMLLAPPFMVRPVK